MTSSWTRLPHWQQSDKMTKRDAFCQPRRHNAPNSIQPTLHGKRRMQQSREKIKSLTLVNTRWLEISDASRYAEYNFEGRMILSGHRDAVEWILRLARRTLSGICFRAFSFYLPSGSSQTHHPAVSSCIDRHRTVSLVGYCLAVMVAHSLGCQEM